MCYSAIGVVSFETEYHSNKVLVTQDIDCHMVMVILMSPTIRDGCIHSRGCFYAGDKKQARLSAGYILWSCQNWIISLCHGVNIT